MSIQKLLGKLQIDLDKSMIVCRKQILDDVHIISIEFGDEEKVYVKVKKKWKIMF